MSQLMTPSIQVLTTPIAKLSSKSKDQDLTSSKEDQSWKLSLSKVKRFIHEVKKQVFSIFNYDLTGTKSSKQGNL